MQPFIFCNEKICAQSWRAVARGQSRIAVYYSESGGHFVELFPARCWVKCFHAVIDSFSNVSQMTSPAPFCPPYTSAPNSQKHVSSFFLFNVSITTKHSCINWCRKAHYCSWENTDQIGAIMYRIPSVFNDNRGKWRLSRPALLSLCR